MLILVTYDVSTEDNAGKKRLRRVAKECVNYGTRVQNSVFECVVDGAKLRLLKEKLINVIDPEKDSLRFYCLGNNYKTKVEHYGVKMGLDLEEPLIF
ncbi:CRISPR-associated endonuclease Cas2 [uncultured Ruminococcus sp.]|uniref:CRISPR-associated endonuclease Cas2 n=1 Tax=uncultured Ruminococcus sp. TaxID=165186 RepID=UPI00260CF9C9|nr:CRISPR-associated endonuclease Cas2 [uncultured Ruminococcus sp.]